MLHSPQVHGFFSIPADPLTARHVFQRHYRERDLSETIVVAPDVGHAKSAGRFAESLGLPVAAGNKERISDFEVRITGLVGRQVKGFRRALVYDDEIATGTSVLEMSKLLIDNNIEDIAVVCTHGVFVSGALDRLADIPQITEIVTSNTVFIPPEKQIQKLTILSVAPIFGEAIRRNYARESIAGLFVYGDD
jgi:ribose-phosphate pyrophosphokinase